MVGLRYFRLVWHLCVPYKPFQLAWLHKIPVDLHSTLVSPKSTLVAKRYIMLLAVGFILELGFSGLLKFKAS